MVVAAFGAAYLSFIRTDRDNSGTVYNPEFKIEGRDTLRHSI
jgi:hypothetical protein